MNSMNKQYQTTKFLVCSFKRTHTSSLTHVAVPLAVAAVSSCGNLVFHVLLYWLGQDRVLARTKHGQDCAGNYSTMLMKLNLLVGIECICFESLLKNWWCPTAVALETTLDMWP